VYKLSCPFSKLECHVENLSSYSPPLLIKSDIYRLILNYHLTNVTWNRRPLNAKGCRSLSGGSSVTSVSSDKCRKRCATYKYVFII
jgi:hypothetical protein